PLILDIDEPLDHDGSLDTDGHITAGLTPIDDIPMNAERRSTTGVTASLPGEEPSQFQCELCHKKFPYNCYLTMHMRKNHDKSKPYGCKVCHYRFGYRGTLLRHQLIHSSQRVQPGSHGSIIFKCRICSAKFLELKQLNVHLKTHRKVVDEQDTNRQVQLIRCDECPQIFSDPDQLAVHMLKEHQKHHSSDDELYDSERMVQQQHAALLLNPPSSSLRGDSNRTGSSTLNDLKLNSEQSKDDTDEAFMNDNDISLIKIEPNYD
uniref:C2H2-type domain-containing protein n=1 Tax=Anopheles maculatus TaxID=74869 RepID=A0A182SA46_9DIPT